MTRITQHDGPARARRAADAAAKPKYQRHPIQRRWCFGFAAASWRRPRPARQAHVWLSVSIRVIRGVSDPGDPRLKIPPAVLSPQAYRPVLGINASPGYRFEDEARRLRAWISAAGIARPA
jgi:hypothetical protein